MSDPSAFSNKLRQRAKGPSVTGATDKIGCPDYGWEYYAQWMANPSRNIIFARLPRKSRAALGTPTMAILMSAATMKKQKLHHPEITLAE